MVQTPALEKGDANVVGSSTALATGVQVGHDAGSEIYTLNVYNTTDNSERLRIIHNAEDDGMAATPTHGLT